MHVRIWNKTKCATVTPFRVFWFVTCKNQDEMKQKNTWNIKKNIYHRFSHILRGCFFGKSIKCHPNPCKLWKNGSVSDQFKKIFQVDLVKNQITLLRLVGVTFQKLAWPLRMCVACSLHVWVRVVTIVTLCFCIRVRVNTTARQAKDNVC